MPASVLLPPRLGELRARASPLPAQGPDVLQSGCEACSPPFSLSAEPLLRLRGRGLELAASPYGACPVSLRRDVGRQERGRPCPPSFPRRPPSLSLHPAPLSEPWGPALCRQLEFVGSDPPTGRCSREAWREQVRHCVPDCGGKTAKDPARERGQCPGGCVHLTSSGEGEGSRTKSAGRTYIFLMHGIWGKEQ